MVARMICTRIPCSFSRSTSWRASARACGFAAEPVWASAGTMARNRNKESSDTILRKSVLLLFGSDARRHLPPGREITVDGGRGIAAVANRPHYQRGAAHDIAGREHPVQAAHHGAAIGLDGPPARHG